MYYKYNIHLKKGWNLISFFLVNVSLDLFIKNENIITITNLTHTYSKENSITELNKLTINSAYWINSKQDIIIESNGVVNKNDINISLYKGWNLVGYPHRFSWNISSVINNKNITHIKSNNLVYNSLLPANLNTLKEFEPGSGYWFYVENDTDIKFKYPFEYNQVNEYSMINGLVLLDDFSQDELKEDFIEVNYKIQTTSESYVEIPHGIKNISSLELDNILKHINGLTFSIYYGFLDGLVKSIGINFYNNFKVLKGFNGKIKIKPKFFEDGNKLIEIYFNDKAEDRILFNIKKNIIVIGIDGSNVFINNILFV